MNSFFEVTEEDIKIVATRMGLSLSDEQIDKLMGELDLDFESELVHIDSLNEQTDKVLDLLQVQISELVKEGGL